MVYIIFDMYIQKKMKFVAADKYESMRRNNMNTSSYALPL